MPDRPIASVPTVPVPQGDYVPAVVHADLAFSAGMTPRVDGRLAYTGLVGADLDVDMARAAAEIAARNAIAAVAAVAGGMDRLQRCLRLTVYVAATPGFERHSAVADGASAVIARLLPNASGFSRSAIGVASLPSGAPVEVEVTVALHPAAADESSRHG